MKPVLFALNQSQKPKRILTFSQLGGLLLTLALLTTPMLNPRQRAPIWAHAASMRHSVQTLLPTLQGAAAVAYLQQQALYTSLVTAVNVATPAAMSGSTFVQQAYLKASNTDVDDRFGGSLAISGDTVVVGAMLESSNATGVNGDETNNAASAAGAAYVFVRSGAIWHQQAYLKASDPERLNGDDFGFAVAIDGDTIVVSATREDSNAIGVNGDEHNNAAPSSGAAYVFVRSGTTWSQQAYLKASNTERNDNFGAAVAVSGNTVVIGAPAEDSNAIGVNGDEHNNAAPSSGAAYVFNCSGTTWRQEAYLKASNTDTDDFFGTSVAIDKDTIVVGAYWEYSNATGVDGDGNNDAAPHSGAAYVFVRDSVQGTPAWSQQAYLKASNTGAEDWFGISVAVSNDTVVVGASAEDSNATGVNGDQMNDVAQNSGAVYVFVRNAGVWTQQAYLKASNTGPTDWFGNSIAISNDLLVVGAYWEDSNATGVDGDGNNDAAPLSGATYVFVRSGALWRQQSYLKASNVEAEDQFGWSVAFGGATVVVGAFHESSNAIGINGDQNNNAAHYSGAVYVFAPDPSLLTVNTTVDPGDGVCTVVECTLRAAIALANTLPGENTIAFNIPGSGPHTIQPIGNLPAITDRLIIDGYTQPGAHANTNRAYEPINSVILIELDGVFAQTGLVVEGVNANGSVIRGLAINRFAEVGIESLSTIVIEGNFIGVDPLGTTVLGNGVGIRIVGPTGGMRAEPLVGGETPAARNLISGNDEGIAIGANSSPIIQGNFIGSDATGTQPLGNKIGITASGPVLGNEFTSVKVGGLLTGEPRNLISGNGQGAVYTYVRGETRSNIFGADRTGAAPLPNLGDGLVVLSASHLIDYNGFVYNGGNGIRAIAPTNPNVNFLNQVNISHNTIAHNGQDGITLPGNSPQWQLVPIGSNVIYDNGELGIDLGDDGVTVNDGGDGQPDNDSGPNFLLNYPSLQTVGSDGAELVVAVSGRLNNRTLGVELFASPSCDPTGYGEGEVAFHSLILVKDELDRIINRLFTLPIDIPPGYVLTATATDSAVITPGERSSFTSEFSPCYTVAGVINPHLKQVAVTTNYDPATTWPGAPAGTFTIAATFQNISDAPLTELFFKVKSLTNHNRLVDAIGGPGDPVGAGAVQLGVDEVAPGMSFTVTFRIGLTERKPFTFLIDTYGVAAAGYAATAATNATTRFTYTATNEALHDVIEQNNLLYLPLINR